MSYSVARCVKCANTLNENGVCALCASVKKYAPEPETNPLDRPFSERFYLILFVVMFIIYCLAEKYF